MSLFRLKASVAKTRRLLEKVRPHRHGADGGRTEHRVYLAIARIKDLVDDTTSSEDAGQSKTAPDIFQITLKKLGIAAAEVVAIGDESR
jgi:beta-phosphoglucomutase-like phosphatase (HAD superfamily)